MPNKKFTMPSKKMVVALIISAFFFSGCGVKMGFNFSNDPQCKLLCF